SQIPPSTSAQRTRAMPLLELSDVAAGYRDPRQSQAVPVLFEVSLRVEEGEIVALLGPNGAGKTTTLRTIAGLLRPLAGTVMTDARLLLIDEASLGLAPKLVAALFEVVARLRGDGRSILLVEQNANLALDVADRAYVMEKGRLHETGAAGVVEQDRLAELYLG